MKKFLVILCYVILIFSPAFSVANENQISDNETVQTDLQENLDKEEQDTYKYCADELKNTQQCPDDKCAIVCGQKLQQRACVVECLPKACIDINPEICPSDICMVLKGCNDKDLCYPKEMTGTLECGGIAYAGDDIPCCEGFVKRCGIEFFDGSCDMIGSGSLDSVPICIPCGNGICNQFENRCNCPEDCKNDTSMIELLKEIRKKKQNIEDPKEEK